MSLLTSLANASLVGAAASSGAAAAVLSASRPIVEEGDEVQFILYVPDGVEGTTYAYSITGITADDLFYGALTGNFTLDSLQGAQVSIILATDSVSEIETITMAVSSLNLSVQVAITDTSPAPVGEAVYDTAGTYQWVCPAGVTKVSAVAIGPGGNGFQVYYNQTSTRPISGAGGGLGWKNNIAVTPGQTYTVRVGTSGTLDSYFISTSTVRGGYGVNGSIYPSAAAAGGTYTGDGGGNGGSSPLTLTNASISGGGGAGGWNSSGGSGGYYNGSTTSFRNGLSSTNGGGGGASGYFSYAPGYLNDYGGVGGRGGGNHLFGITSPSYTSSGGVWAGSSSGGNYAAPGGSYPNTSSGVFGAGGYSAAYVYSYTAAQLAGGKGGVRIMWGEGRSFPYNAGYVAPPNGGTSVTLQQILNNPNAYSTSGLDIFGITVAMSGNYAIVGASSEDDAGGLGSGKAYIFNVTTGALVHTLDNPNAYGTSTDDNFGYSVAISGNYCIVGAHNEDDAGGTGSGKAYIFDVTTGSLVHTLDNPNAYGTSELDSFGLPVAMSGNYAIVGAYWEGGVQAGTAYIFDVTTGSLVHTLDNPNPYGTIANDYFGRSVAISSNYAIVGARGEDEASGNESGKAYIFDVLTGDLVHTLDNPNAYSESWNDEFGKEVSISGNYAIVGAPGERDAGGNSSGKAYIFDVTTGTLVHVLNNPNAYSTSASDFFGYAVAISGNYAIVGAHGENDADGDLSGVAYIFDVTTGTLLHTLNNPNSYSTGNSDYFGISVGISGNYVIVGAYAEDDASGNESGKAYIYRLNQT